MCGDRPSAEWHRDVWSAQVAPQHFAASASGAYKLFENSRCGPIKNRIEAYARNAVADRVLLRGRGPFSAVARSWSLDVGAWASLAGR